MKYTLFSIKKVPDGWTCLHDGFVFNGKTAKEALDKAFLFAGETDESGSITEDNGAQLDLQGCDHKPPNCS